MLALLSVLLLLLVFAGTFDGDKNMFILSILFLQTSMVFVYTAFKQQQKRIDALEEQLSNNRSEN